jgi:hypothetical protein
MLTDSTLATCVEVSAVVLPISTFPAASVAMVKNACVELGRATHEPDVAVVFEIQGVNGPPLTELNTV